MGGKIKKKWTDYTIVLRGATPVNGLSTITFTSDKQKIQIDGYNSYLITKPNGETESSNGIIKTYLAGRKPSKKNNPLNGTVVVVTFRTVSGT